MENQEKATQILDRQIFEVQEKINQTKIEIADAFIKITTADIKNMQSPKDVLPFIEEMEKMPQRINTINAQEKALAVLTKSRAEISTVCSSEFIK